MDTLIIVWALGGFLAGFFIEYLIDVFWWRRRMRRANVRGEQAEALLREQVEEVEYLRFQLAKFNESFDEYDRYTKKLEYDLESKRVELDDLRVQHEASDARSRQFQADVVQLRRQVEQQTRPEEIGDVERQVARYKRALYDSVNENRRLASQLRDAEGRLAALQGGDASLLINETDADEAYKPVEAGLLTTDGDPLEKINGIGNVYADRLRAAGIRTFADLSRMRAERLTDIIQPQKWQQIEPDRWIAEAADYASLNASNGDVR